MEGYKESCPIPLEQVNKEIDGLTSRLSQTLMENFKTDVKVRHNVCECLKHTQLSLYIIRCGHFNAKGVGSKKYIRLYFGS